MYKCIYPSWYVLYVYTCMYIHCIPYTPFHIHVHVHVHVLIIHVYTLNGVFMEGS